MDDRPTLMDELRVLRQAVPGALVFVAVLLLLRGYDGTVYVLGRQASMLAESFLGGPDVLIPVLAHTLPLALAAGVASFAISAGWVRFESFWSVIVLSGIIIAGTTVGGLLRTFLPEPAVATVDNDVVGLPSESLHPASAQMETTHRVAPLHAASGIQGIGVLSSSSLSQPSLLTPTSPLQAATQPSAWQQLSEIDFLAIPDLAKPPPAEITPIQVVPKVSGILNVVGLAINQLLGFLVAYQPRLFLAAVLAGGWTGWRWQQRLGTLKQHLDSDDERHGQDGTTPLRRAA